MRSSAADWELEAITAFSGYWTESYTRPTLVTSAGSSQPRGTNKWQKGD